MFRPSTRTALVAGTAMLAAGILATTAAPAFAAETDSQTASTVDVTSAQDSSPTPLTTVFHNISGRSLVVTYGAALSPESRTLAPGESWTITRPQPGMQDFKVVIANPQAGDNAIVEGAIIGGQHDFGPQNPVIGANRGFNLTSTRIPLQWNIDLALTV